MSIATVPTWTLGDRMAKARESAGITVNRMSELIGVSRTTITNYEHGRTDPSRAVLMTYAVETEVPLWWLEGSTPPAGVEIRSRCFSASPLVEQATAA